MNNMALAITQLSLMFMYIWGSYRNRLNESIQANNVDVLNKNFIAVTEESKEWKERAIELRRQLNLRNNDYDTLRKELKFADERILELTKKKIKVSRAKS